MSSLKKTVKTKIILCVSNLYYTINLLKRLNKQHSFCNYHAIISRIIHNNILFN